MKLNRKRTTYWLVAIASFLIITVVGAISYAYFTTTGTIKNQTSEISTATVSVRFRDADDTSINEILNFGDSVTKYFTIENTGTVNTTVRMYWSNLINTYTINSLTYTLSYSTERDGNYTVLINDKSIPRSLEASKKILANDIFIPVDTTYYYKLDITLNYLENVNQKDDLNAIFNSEFAIEDVPNSTRMMMATSYDYTGEIWGHRDTIKKIVFEDTKNEKANAAYTYNLSENQQTESVMAFLVPDSEDPTMYIAYIQSDGKILANTNSSHLFYEFTKLESIEGLENFDTGNVTDMNSMFSGCNSLTTIDLNNFDTSNVTSMSYMFYNCKALKSLDLSNFDTSKVTNMNHVFYGCSKLTTLDLSNFDTSKVTNMNHMFYGCGKLTTLDVGSFDTSKVTNMWGLFENCKSLTTLDVGNFDTSNVTDMRNIFSNCSSLIILNLSNFNTSKVTNMSSMFAWCSSLTTINLISFDTSKVTNMSSMFYNCSSLTTLDVSNFDTSMVTYMENMFASCRSMTILNLSNFNTSKVTDMSGMFNVCYALTTLDLSSFDTSNVTDMNFMFAGCSSLITLDLSSFDTSKVTNMEIMFSSCSSLTELDLSGFNTSNVTNMNQMFYQCNKLSTTLNINDTKCTSYSDMFSGAATAAEASITVNYTANASSLVNNMIATKSSNSNVTLGSVIN